MAQKTYPTSLTTNGTKTTQRARGSQILTLTLLVGLTGCAHLPGPSLSKAAAPIRNVNVAHVLEKTGLGKLRAGDYKEASQIFNAGLKFEPTSANLNFLNGLTYQMLYLQGNQDMLGLATVGFKLALRADPAHFDAALQLGRLQFEAKRYNRAAKAFQRAIDIRPDSGAAYLGLADADYYLRRLHSARTSADKAETLMPASASAARAQAMIYAALGQFTKARAASAHYARLERNSFARASLARRVHEWHLWHVSYPEQPVAYSAGPNPMLLAQASGLPQVFSPKPVSNTSSMPSPITQSSTPTTPSTPRPKAASPSRALPRSHGTTASTETTVVVDIRPALAVLQVTEAEAVAAMICRHCRAPAWAPQSTDGSVRCRVRENEEYRFLQLRHQSAPGPEPGLRRLESR